MSLSTLDLLVQESPTSNDHEVRVIIDGKDWLNGNRLGIDPPQLKRQLASQSGGELLLGRCECGCLGCDDFDVEVRQNAHTTEWHLPGGGGLRFQTEDYLRRIDVFLEDHSWEPIGRTVERRIDELFAGQRTLLGHIFQWSSARFRHGVVVLSLWNDSTQRLIELDGNPLTSCGTKRCSL